MTMVQTGMIATIKPFQFQLMANVQVFALRDV
jgi:hypothetical protein